METNILAQTIANSIIKEYPTIGTLWEHTDSYETVVDLIKDLLDHDLQLKDL
jgi:hypothetical protein|tara:strand:+ start:196 stop:351 length:156 start_codon:yes stop_codon:yes gene_type:complete